MNFMGIDPGTSGGMAVLHRSGGVNLKSMPGEPSEILEYFGRWAGDINMAVLERVTGYVGGRGDTGSSMFKFGTNYGMVIMALEAMSIPYELVGASDWQRELEISPRKGRTKVQWKNYLLREALDRFPTIQPTLATADALLIAQYCRTRFSEGVKNA